MSDVVVGVELEERAKEVIKVIDDYAFHGVNAGATREPTVPSTTMEALGFDSLDLVEVLMEIEDHFGIEIPDEHVPDNASVEDLIKAVYSAFGEVYGE